MGGALVYVRGVKFLTPHIHLGSLSQRTKMVASRVAAKKGPMHHLVLVDDVSFPFCFSIFCQVHVALGRSQVHVSAMPLDLQNHEPK